MPCSCSGNTALLLPTYPETTATSKKRLFCHVEGTVTSVHQLLTMRLNGKNPRGWPTSHRPTESSYCGVSPDKKRVEAKGTPRQDKVPTGVCTEGRGSRAHEKLTNLHILPSYCPCYLRNFALILSAYAHAYSIHLNFLVYVYYCICVLGDELYAWG